MHETRMMRSIVETVLDRARQARAARVLRVELAISSTGHLTEEGVRGHFAALAAGTVAADAVLVVTALPGNYLCIGCGRAFSSLERAAVCAGCGNPASALPGQDACYLGAIDVVCSDGGQATS